MVTNHCQKDRRLAVLALLPFAIVFFLFQILPLGVVMVESFGEDLGERWGLGNYRLILESRFFRQSIVNSLKISLYSSLIALVIAIIGAYSLSRITGRLRNAFASFCQMVANFSGVPLAFAFTIIIGTNGSLTLLLRSTGILDHFSLYSFPGMVLIYTYFQIPLALLLLYPAFDALKDEWQEAATILGASRLKYWRHIALPILGPSVLCTLIILFANAMGTYATAFALTSGSYNLMTIRIGHLIAGDLFLDPWLAGALSMYLVGILVTITLLNEYLIQTRKRHGYA